ncbi:RAB6A-GEF complex partner protein 1 [Gracilariopsis chorda]|uniref:RAB6A-GEF complex partner protein 1 n=1 Tax=Gracilariopsis chorda TaxID=448386 RepID=A0A2V3IXV8_9FLOR|nr:RAB6A-GEF complex partner protein 1 [Gracilariopsis chorda]|eukprot:PXF46986.1 RAB6A-GEF complex partner protein 1 [Gracilariopsis chorda]
MGYFVTGHPKTYVLPPTAVPPQPPSSVRHIQPDASSKYVLTLTDYGLYLWSAQQHRVLLARFLISSRVLDEEGPFVSAVWSPDSTRITAALSNGLVLLFSVRPHASRSVLHFEMTSDHLSEPAALYPLQIKRIAELRVAHGSTLVTAITSTPAGALIATSSAILTCIAWDADMLWRAHIPELLRCNNALEKMGVVTSHSQLAHPAVQAILEPDARDDAGGITDMCYNSELGYLAIVLGSGPALLLALHSNGFNRPSAIDGRWLRSDHAVAVALEPKRMLATVGLTTSDVEQYYIGVPAGDHCPVMRTLSLSNWYFEPTDVGAARVLRWTEDGYALLVGWEKQGLAVWSVSGCRLMWTLPQVGGTLPTTPALLGKDLRSHASPMENGVLAACWGPKGFFLWAAPRVSDSTEALLREGHFMEFSFYKATPGTTSYHSTASRLAMYGSDRILMLWKADESAREHHDHSGKASNDIFAWQHLIIPSDYLWRNWPPSCIAVNSDSSYVAVAGEHGMAICHVKMQRWRVFGDLQQDKRIRCCALAWLGRTIVVGNEVPPARPEVPDSASRFELLFYARDHLEASALQAQRDLPSRPILTDVRADGYLLVICEDAQVVLYKVTERVDRSYIDIREVYRLFLPTREMIPLYQQDKQTKVGSSSNKALPGVAPPAPGGGISEARIFPPLSAVLTSDSSEPPVPKHIMMLRNTGSLILLDTESMVSTALLRYVERFWYTPVDCTPFDLISHRPVWWAYGDDGIHVCFHDGIAKKDDFDVDLPLDPSLLPYITRRKGVEVEQWFELDPEVYPLSIMSQYGMLLGATQGLVLHNIEVESAPVPSYAIQVKRQPILHTLLRHLLIKPKMDERTTLQVALKCVSQPQFIDSLEWLLYEAVLEHEDDQNVLPNGDNARFESDNKVISQNSEESTPPLKPKSRPQVYPESPRRQKAGSNLFPRVIRLLRYFGEYEDIVVRCARKLDSKRWPLLFSLAGEPAALLEQCFVSGRLRTAACLLVILQEMWGFISSTPHSLRLVEAALERGELELAADLAGFLGKADRAGMLNSSQLRTNEDVSWIGEAVGAPKGDALNSITLNHSTEKHQNRIPAVDLAVLNHARLLLNKMDLRNLAALAVRMNFPLAEWLRRELKGKNASRPFVRDFSTTILSLHRQFQFPEPDMHDVRKAMRAFNEDVDTPRNRGASEQDLKQLSEFTKIARAMKLDEDRNEKEASDTDEVKVSFVDYAAESAFGSQLPPPPASYDSEMLVSIRAKAKQLCGQELNYLMTVGRVARAPDIILCCATLLLDISVLRMVLRGHGELFEPYIAALHEFNVPGYNALVAVLNEIAAPR